MIKVLYKIIISSKNGGAGILSSEVKLETIRRFWADINKYREFILSSIVTELKTEYAKSYIGYLWWILDPVLFMFIYVFVVSIVLKRGGPGFPVFLFSGLLFWRWTSSSILRCTSSIVSKRSILSQIYIPKFILPLIRTGVDSIYFLFSILVLLLLLVIYKIPFTLHILEFIPIFLVQYLFIFGMGLWLSHMGVYYYDVDRVLGFILRVVYYLSPGLYALEAIPLPYRQWFWVNPLTTVMISSRNAFMYGKSPLYLNLLIWTIINLLLIYTGLKKLYKFDRTYAKVF